MRSVSTLMVAFASLTSTALAEMIPRSEFAYQNWQGAAFTFSGTSDFSHCVISAPYVSGDILYLSVNAGGTVGVGVQSNNLQLSVGETFPVMLTIDGRAPIHATATASTTNFATLNIPNFDAAMTALKKGRGLRVDSAVGQASYDLSGTFHALDATKECAFKNMAYNGPLPPPANSTAVDKTVLFQVATQMISDLNVSDFVYMTDSEVQSEFQVEGVYWSSSLNGIIGGVSLINRGTMKELNDTDGADVSFLAERCTGDMASSFRSIPVPDILMREIRAICVTPNGTVESRLTKALIGENVLYTLLIFSSENSVQPPVTRDQVSADIAVRAASFVRVSSVGQ